jgi:hypothetical protein
VNQRLFPICCGILITLIDNEGSLITADMKALSSTAPGFAVIVIRMSDRLCGQSSLLQIQRPVFDSRRYQIFIEVVDLERGPLSLVSTSEELRERKSSCSGLEIRGYGRRDPSR